MNSIVKYLETYAEPEIPRGLYRNTFFPNKKACYDFCVVVPLYGEAELWLKNGLPSLIKAANVERRKTLLILVVNRHELSDSWVRKENEATIRFFTAFPKTVVPDFPQMSLYHLEPNVDVFLLDHNEEPYLFYSKEGVGKARKLGCDLALALTLTPHMNCKYIHTTDGDAIVDTDYFEIENSINADILLHPYVHIGDYEQMEALQIYESSLRYYVAGLKFANSPYAHESLGSTISTTPACYAKVRGFPKRNAAEDFYFLNKAVKVGTLHQSESGLVKLVGRKSHRVPFGTGVGTEKIWQTITNKHSVKFYDPRCFKVLKNLIQELVQWSQQLQLKPDRESITRSIAEGALTCDLSGLQELLDSLGFFEILETAKVQRKTQESQLKQLHDSWDGFKTLKFIHGLRNSFLPEVCRESIGPFQDAFERV